MEFFQLDHFVAVVEERSFTRAAERCKVAQSSLRAFASTGDANSIAG